MKPTDVNSGLTVEILKQTLSYDPETGKWSWLNGRTARTDYELYINGEKTNPYHLLTLGRRNYLCHRLAWFYMTGSWPVEMIDHINGNKSDNRLCNLREATRGQNLANRHSLARHNTSGFRGVSPRKDNGKWRATIRDGKKIRSLGSFNTKEEAKSAYDTAFKEKYGEFANTSV